MIYVTGGTGLLGSHLLVDLVKEYDEITSIYRNEDRIELTRLIFKHYFEDQSEFLFSRIQWVKCDILDVATLGEIITEGSDVYHCAAMVSFHPSDFHQLMKINREGTANVVNVCLEKKVRKLCHVSSTAAIGGTDQGLIDENDLWKKTPSSSAYSISKYGAEKEVWRGIEEGLNAVIVNPCVILGPGNWNDSSLAIFKTIARGISFYPSGSNSQVDARDVSHIMLELMKSDISSERFLCIGSNQSVKDMMTIIANHLHVKPPTRKAPKWLANIGRYFIALIYLFRKGKPSISKDSINSMYGIRAYSSRKIEDALHYKFRSIEDTIENAIKGRIILK